MTSTEFWQCDVCVENTVWEEEAEEQGWVVLHRRQFRETVFPAIPGTRVTELRLPARWHDDYTHICAACLEDGDTVVHYSLWKAEVGKENWQRAQQAAMS